VRRGLIWGDRANLSIYGFVVAVVFVVFRGKNVQTWQISATVDQSDIRRSKPYNLDPSRAASNGYRESG
jgi:hypothetical protein